MYEETIYSKLGLEKKFSRIVLYTRQNAIGIGLITPSTVIVMLATKLYVRNKCAKTKIGWIISIIDNKLMTEKGYNTNSIKEMFSTMNKKTWNESIHHLFISRNLSFVNESNEIHLISNKRIMQYMVDYINQNKLKAEVYDQINHIRIFKRVILSVKLIGYQGRAPTECFKVIETLSILQWKV